MKAPGHRFPNQTGGRKRKLGLLVSLTPPLADPPLKIDCVAVSRWDRILVFGGLNLAALALFVLCFTLLPVLALRPSKFAIL